LGYWNVVTLLALACVSTAATADCFEHHAGRFGLDAHLLRAIAHVESSGRPHAVNSSHLERTGSRDIGLMQINSAWLPKLKAYGIKEADLFDGCTSVEVGAWVLHDLVRRFGNTWDAVGAYNAACSQLKGQACIDARSRYAWRVYRRLQATAPTANDLQATPDPRIAGQSWASAPAHSAFPAVPAMGLVSVASTLRSTRAAQDPAATAAAAEGDS
jgi:hypothetical protein